MGGRRRFWSLDPAGRRDPYLLALSGEDSLGFALAPSGNGTPRMAFARGVIKSDIWRVTLGESETRERLIASSRIDSNPTVSPDGGRLVFESNRSGSAELWISDADGGAQRQLTANAPPMAGSAQWSPEGTQLAMPAVVEGRVQIFLVSPESGALTQVTQDDSHKFNPRWSRDGKSILFFLSRERDIGYLARMPVQGGEIERVLSGTPGIVADESPGGSVIVGNRAGQLMEVAPDLASRRFTRTRWPTEMRLTGTGVVFLSPELPSMPGFYFLAYGGGRPELLAEVERPWLGLAISPDGKYLYYSEVEENAFDLHFVDEVW